MESKIEFLPLFEFSGCCCAMHNAIVTDKVAIGKVESIVTKGESKLYLYVAGCSQCFVLDDLNFCPWCGKDINVFYRELNKLIGR